MSSRSPYISIAASVLARITCCNNAGDSAIAADRPPQVAPTVTLAVTPPETPSAMSVPVTVLEESAEE